jgi:hypothetical protein
MPLNESGTREESDPQKPAPIQDAETYSDCASEASDEKRNPKRPSSTRGEITISILTAAIVATYVASSYFSCRQMGLTEKALEQSKIDNANAIRAQQTIAEKTLGATVEQFRLDQRAWVGVTDISIKSTIVPGRRFVWIGYVQNSGRTASLNTVMQFKYRTFPKGETPRFIYGKLTEPQGEIALQPSMKISIGGHEDPKDSPLTELQVRAMQEGITRMYIFGRIEYDDIFGFPHHTHVCAWLDSDLATTHPCRIYNDAN